MAVRSEIQHRTEHLGHLMRAGLPRLWAVIVAGVAVVGGSVVLAVAWSVKHALWGLAAALAFVLVVIIEGSYRESRRIGKRHGDALDELRQAHEIDLANLRAAVPAPDSGPEPLQPRYHHHPMGAQPWVTEHCVGVFNPPGQPARRVRMYLVRMEPYPRNVLPGWPGPVVPYTVPLQRDGDPNAGLTIGPGQEELWIIGYTGTGSDGIMNAGAFAAADYRWRGLPWRFDPDERWRLAYEIVCDGRPDVEFSMVVTAVEGQIRCELQG